MNRYLVLTTRNVSFDSAALHGHYALLDRLRAAGRLELAGPFTDHTGGAYLMRADNLEEACRVAHSDPLHLTGSSTITVHEWAAK